MNRSELTKLLTFLGDVYSDTKFEFPRENKQKTKRRVEAWSEFIGQYDYQLAKDVVKKMIGEGRQWPPEVGEIQSRIKENLRNERRQKNQVFVGQRKARMEIQEKQAQEREEELKQLVKELDERRLSAGGKDNAGDK